jgi:hypothetical protein
MAILQRYRRFADRFLLAGATRPKSKAYPDQSGREEGDFGDAPNPAKGRARPLDPFYGSSRQEQGISVTPRTRATWCIRQVRTRSNRAKRRPKATTHASRGCPEAISESPRRKRRGFTCGGNMLDAPPRGAVPFGRPRSRGAPRRAWGDANLRFCGAPDCTIQAPELEGAESGDRQRDA